MTQPWYVRAYDRRYFDAYADEFSPQQTTEETEATLALLALPPGARILDLCCGFGRHAVEMAKRGYQVTGLDLSPALLDEARKRAQREGVAVTWIEADMRAIPTPAVPYDGVVNLFSAFGFFGDDHEEQRAADAVRRVLKPGGAFLIDTLNREIMLRRWQPLRWRERGDGRLELHRLRLDLRTGILHSDETLCYPDGRRERDEHHTRLWTFTELSALLERAGFASTEVWGGLDASPYTWDSFRMVTLSR